MSVTAATRSLRRCTFSASMQPISTPSVATGPVADVYLVLTGPSADGVATIRVIIQPLVVWIWVGGIVAALGTVLSAFSGADPGRTPGGPERTGPPRCPP
ncbi:MAG: cytochrome c-type biogenesis CcmF C-terminal domain-containing protein [Acidimicrobiales bacterium]